MISPTVSILLLCDDERYRVNTLMDHINAFLNLSRFKVYKYNPAKLPFSFLLDLNEFDVVVIHYSLHIIYDTYIPRDLRKKIHKFRGLKVLYIQDDYRQVDQYTEMMRYLGIHVLFTPYPPEKIPLVYDEKRLPNVTKRTTLTGYVPDRLITLDSPPMEERPIDVGYRGRDIHYWLGTLSREKVWIGEGFLKHAAPYGLKYDIAWKEADRIYGEQWDRFISSCKAMLGTESGSSITDFDGSVEIRTKEYLATHPQADFWEVYDRVLKPFEGNLVENTISPRVFECAAHRTAMILFPGEYSRILEPWVHYIPLQKDFSNMDEVIAKLHDTDLLNAMVDRAYYDLIGSGRYSYRVMVEEFDQVVQEHMLRVPENSRLKTRFWLAQHERRVVLHLLQVFKPAITRVGYIRRHPLDSIKMAVKWILPRPVYNLLRNIYSKNFPGQDANLL